LNAKTRETSTG